jgi:hypothetical protein
MDRIVLDAVLVEKLRANDQTVELIDESGTVIGLFTPKIDPDDYEGLGPDISEEELQRRMNSKEPRYSTADVLRHLERL